MGGKITYYRYHIEGPAMWNQVERLFRRIKRFTRVFTRYDKLDNMLKTFLPVTLIVDFLLYINRS